MEPGSPVQERVGALVLSYASPSFARSGLLRYMDRDISILEYDCFRPATRSERHYLRVRELEPLVEFRNLTSLKLYGMQRSYQQAIWMCVWVNPNLEELELEMVLEPGLKRGYDEKWPSIVPGWRVRSQAEVKAGQKSSY